MYQSRNNEKTSVFRSIDWVTVIVYLLMVAFGAVSIYAASYDFDDASMFAFSEFSGKQIRWIGLGLLVGMVILLIDSRVYDTYAYPLYIAVMILLVITPFVGREIKGSHSWIVLGPMSIQPAEFAKAATALALAKLFSGYNFNLNASPGNYARALLIILLPVALILLQNETGSALVYFSLFFVLYREGMSGLILFAALMAVVVFVVAIKFTESHIMGMAAGQFWVCVLVMITIVGMLIVYGKRRPEVARNVALFFMGSGLVLWIVTGPCGVAVPGLAVMLGLIVVACLYIGFEVLRSRIMPLLIPIGAAFFAIVFMFTVDIAFNKLQAHQQLRIKVVLGLDDDLRGAGYNVNQSKIAIGSGGFTGKGFLEGTQTKLKYVPEQHTDFIFCTIGEEEGFVGAVAVELLFLILIFRIIALAERQPTTFGRVYAYCVASYLIFHFCINIGMVIGLCPVIGIPLPLFSYGGSSLWGFTILIFILLRIDAARKSYYR